MGLKIYVASPLRGDYEVNQAAARRYCKLVVEAGHAPFAPHIFYTQFLDDHIERERLAGMRCGLAWIAACDELWAWGDSEGVLAEIAEAERLGLPVRRVV